MKAALCLSGLVGTTEKYGCGTIALEPKIAYNYFNDNVFKPNKNVDVFIHSWSLSESKKLTDLYKPVSSLFENQNKLKLHKDNLRIFSIYSKWYSNKEVISLLRRYEKKHNFKYDYVMLARFDLALRKEIIFANLDINSFYHLGTDPIHKISNKHSNRDKSCCNKLSYNFEINDLWFISNSDNMFNFAKAYDNIKNLISKSTWPSNHCIAAQQLRNIGLFDKRKVLLEQKIHLPPGDGDSPLVRWIK